MSSCPYCNYIATEHEELEDKGNVPEIGDVSFCINCAEISTYSKVGLIKIDIITLPNEVQQKLKKIYDAWIQTKYLTKIKNLQGEK